MKLEQLTTLGAISQFLEGTQAVAFSVATSKQERYRWVQRTLVIARELVEAGLASGELSRDDQYTIVETYNGVPTHISENGSVTWGLRLEDGEVSLISAVPENADKRVRGDYEVTLPIARAPYIADVIPMPATQALVRKALAQRRLVVLGGEQGDRPRPAVLNGLHNRLVEVTA